MADINNLTATVNGSTVTLTWTNGSNTAMATVKRDGVTLHSQFLPFTSYTDNNVPEGTHTYTVQSLVHGTTGTTSATVTTPPPPTTLYGVYRGNGNLAGVHSFETAVGRKMDGVSDYCDGSSWGGITNPPGISNWQGSGYRLFLGVNPGPDSLWTPHGGNTTSAWAAIVAGQYDANYTALANFLKNLGITDPILRVAWELGANQPWSPVSSSDQWAAGISRIAGLLKAVLPNALVDFNPVWGFTNFPETPQPTGVDLYTVDTYDQSWDGSIFPGGSPNNTCTTAQSDATWNSSMTTNNNSVASIQQAAAAAGKGFGFPETSVAIRNDGHGLGDDPEFFVNLNSYIHQVAPTYVSFYAFQDSGGNYDFTSGSFPNALAKFKALTW